jgi:hypothetical protein
MAQEETDVKTLCAIFRWDHFVGPEEAVLTAQWFAAWTRLNGDHISRRGTAIFLEVTCHAKPFYVSYISDLHRRREELGRLTMMVPNELRDLAQAGRDPETIAPSYETESATRRDWQPNAPAVLMRAVQLKRSRVAKWNTPNKRAANQFLDEIGYKRPFICIVSGTVGMLFEKCPHYFLPYARRIWMTELKAYGPNTPLDKGAALTWLGDGTNFASLLKDPTLSLFNLAEVRKLFSERENSSEEPIIHLLIPNIREQFAGLLE